MPTCPICGVHPQGQESSGHGRELHSYSENSSEGAGSFDRPNALRRRASSAWRRSGEPRGKGRNGTPREGTASGSVDRPTFFIPGAASLPPIERAGHSRRRRGTTQLSHGERRLANGQQQACGEQPLDEPRPVGSNTDDPSSERQANLEMPLPVRGHRTQVLDRGSLGRDVQGTRTWSPVLEHRRADRGKRSRPSRQRFPRKIHQHDRRWLLRHPNLEPALRLLVSGELVEPERSSALQRPPASMGTPQHGTRPATQMREGKQIHSFLASSDRSCPGRKVERLQDNVPMGTPRGPGANAERRTSSSLAALRNQIGLWHCAELHCGRTPMPIRPRRIEADKTVLGHRRHPSIRRTRVANLRRRRLVLRSSTPMRPQAQDEDDRD